MFDSAASTAICGDFDSCQELARSASSLWQRHATCDGANRRGRATVSSASPAFAQLFGVTTLPVSAAFVCFGRSRGQDGARGLAELVTAGHLDVPCVRVARQSSAFGHVVLLEFGCAVDAVIKRALALVR